MTTLYRLKARNGVDGAQCTYVCPKCHTLDKCWYHVDAAWMMP
jgi:hypothetical protein